MLPSRYDTRGCIPLGKDPDWVHDEQGGPPGWGGWNQIDWPGEDQWTYQAVADIILADSLLRSLPQVDPERIGVTGISWGGYLTCIAAGVDRRFKLAVPVYGCGFTDQHAFAGSVKGLGPERARRWMACETLRLIWGMRTCHFSGWMAATILPTRSTPCSYPIACPRERARSAFACACRTGTNPARRLKRLAVFADSILKNGTPLAKITGQGRDGTNVWASYAAKDRVARAELNYTKDTGRWQDRNGRRPLPPSQTTGLPAHCRMEPAFIT